MTTAPAPSTALNPELEQNIRTAMAEIRPVLKEACRLGPQQFRLAQACVDSCLGNFITNIILEVARERSAVVE